MIVSGLVLQLMEIFSLSFDRTIESLFRNWTRFVKDDHLFGTSHSQFKDISTRRLCRWYTLRESKSVHETEKEISERSVNLKGSFELCVLASLTDLLQDSQAWM